MWRPAHFISVAALCGIALVASCTKPNPLYCAVDRECQRNEARICDLATNECVECAKHDDCKAASEPACDPDTNKCRACSNGLECAARDPKTPVCLTFGGCAECGKDLDCKGADKPVCDVNTHSCRACGANTECAAVSAATPVCAPTGSCLGCATRADCGAAEKPICDQATATCRACQSATDCATTGQVCFSTGRCLECETNADCKVPAKPICTPGTNTCRGCQADSECPAEPGVCMAHVDGHCAIPSETIYVSDDKTDTCGAPATGALAGTVTNPACTLQAGAELVSGTRRLIVVRGAVPAGDARVVNSGTGVESIVGQKQATVTALGPALTLSTGALYVRDLKLASAYSHALTATGGTLRLDHVLIDNNANGGIVLDGAAFDIRNTTVTNSGPGIYGAYTVGGILVRGLPNAGPKQLLNVSIQGNKPYDVDCADAIMASGILTTTSLPNDFGGHCDISACDPPGPMCGAQ